MLLISSLTLKGFRLFELKIDKIVYSVDKEAVVIVTQSIVDRPLTIGARAEISINKSTSYIVDKLLSAARCEGVRLWSLKKQLNTNNHEVWSNGQRQ
jgi:hypothetical protein